MKSQCIFIYGYNIVFFFPLTIVTILKLLVSLHSSFLKSFHHCCLSVAEESRLGKSI